MCVKLIYCGEEAIWFFNRRADAKAVGIGLFKMQTEYMTRIRLSGLKQYVSVVIPCFFFHTIRR
mgnify:CR=1 FL=1